MAATGVTSASRTPETILSAAGAPCVTSRWGETAHMADTLVQPCACFTTTHTRGLGIALGFTQVGLKLKTNPTPAKFVVVHY